MTIILLIVMSVVSFTVEMAFGDHPETGWIESVAILISVAIIVNVAAATDYFKVRVKTRERRESDAEAARAPLLTCSCSARWRSIHSGRTASSLSHDRVSST